MLIDSSASFFYICWLSALMYKCACKVLGAFNCSAFMNLGFWRCYSYITGAVYIVNIERFREKALKLVVCSGLHRASSKGCGYAQTVPMAFKNAAPDIFSGAKKENSRI